MRKISQIFSARKKIVIVILFSNLVTVLNFLLDWPLVKIANQRASDFVDLKLVFDSIECAKLADSNISLNSLYLTCNYIYGSPLILFGKFLNLNLVNASIMAWLLIVTSCSILGAIVGVYTSNTSKAMIFTFLVNCSPSISLLFERANLDALIFILVIVSAWLYSKNLLYFSFTLIFVVTLFKFYTLPLLLIISFLHTNKRNFFVLIPLVLGTTINVFADLARIKKLPAGGQAQFGTGVFSWYFDSIGIYVHKALWIIMGVILTLITTFLLMQFSKNFISVPAIKSSFQSLSASEVALSWSSVVFLSCFLFGFNYDYRLVFFAFGGFLLLRLETSPRNSFVLHLLFFLSIWGTIHIGFSFDDSFPLKMFFASIQLIGDISTLIFASCLLAYFLKTFEFNSKAEFFEK